MEDYSDYEDDLYLLDTICGRDVNLYEFIQSLDEETKRAFIKELLEEEIG